MKFPFTEKLHSESIIVKELLYRNSLLKTKKPELLFGGRVEKYGKNRVIINPKSLRKKRPPIHYFTNIYNNYYS